MFIIHILLYKVGKLLPQLVTLQTTEAGSDDEEGSEGSEMGLQDLVERTLEVCLFSYIFLTYMK